jgi:hypothetical protein
MSKERNDLFVVIIFSIIWIVRPISYDEMRSRHPIYPQENVVIVTSSSISNQNDELDFLESTTRDIILAKDTSGNFFADGFTPPLPKRQGGRTTNGIGGSNPGNGSGGSSSAPSSGNLDGNCPSNPTPKFPYQLSPNNRNQNKNKNKKNSIEVKIVNGEIIVRLTRDGMPFFIDEMTARKKIYHAPDFGVALPDNLDLEYVKSLSTKDRLKYLSDPGILPQKCVGEYMKKLGQHLLDPTTEIKVGTLGGNGATKGWNEPIPGTHAFNSGTGNDVFFADKGFKFHTGMNLNDGQRIDLEDNNNIL